MACISYSLVLAEEDKDFIDLHHMQDVPCCRLRFLLAKLRGYEGQQRAHLAGVHKNGITEPRDCVTGKAETTR